MAFPASATGDAIKTQRRIAPQSSILDYDAFSTIRDFRQNGGPLPISKGFVERLAYDASGAPLLPLPSKTDLAQSVMPLGDVDPSDFGLIHMLVDFFGQYAITDNTTWYEWIFGLDGATAAGDFFKLLEDNDAWPRTRFLNCKVGSMTLAADPGGNYAIEFGIGRGRYDFWSDATQTVGSGADHPTVMGAYQAAWTDAGDVDLFIEAQVVAGEVITIRAKIGTGAAYSNTQTYTMGDEPIRLEKEDGTEAGDNFGEPITVFWPAGATLVSLDEFRMDHQRARWSDSLGTAQPIASVNTQLFSDDASFRAEGGWTLNAEWENFEVLPDVSRKQGGIVKRRGKLIVTCEIEREMVGSAFQAKLHNGDTVSIVIDGRTDSLIVAGQPYVGRFIIPAGRLSGVGFTPDVGAGNTSESLKIVAGVPAATYTYDGDGYDSHFHAKLHNNRAAL